jgi:aspartyl-tRNA(Asn)/glutamyl-tRNA(Gln) amidotransferase subunit C
MALTLEDVRKIANLARLRFSPEDEQKLAGQLSRVVDYIDQLQSYEVVADAAPGSPAPGVPEADDRPQECLPREVFLANAPSSLDGFLLVPEVKGSADAS